MAEEWQNGGVTCLTTHSVHREVVNAMGNDEFIVFKAFHKSEGRSEGVTM